VKKYQFTCMIDFRRVFPDGANGERINFRGGIVGNVKKHAVPSVSMLLFVLVLKYVGYYYICLE
jgi:hypothetical protein